MSERMPDIAFIWEVVLGEIFISSDIISIEEVTIVVDFCVDMYSRR